MKPQELRIGNYIEFHAIGIPENGIDILDIRDIAEGRIIIPPKPIPITEEWLLKFGFVYRNECRGKNSIMDFNQSSWKKRMSVGILDDGITVLSYPQPSIRYVHQLQNLYFALTGEELEIK